MYELKIFAFFETPTIFVLVEWGVTLKSFYSLLTTITMKYRTKTPKKSSNPTLGQSSGVLILEATPCFL